MDILVCVCVILTLVVCLFLLFFSPPQVSGWIENVGERLLEECSVLEDSLEVLLQMQRHFSEFDGVACVSRG